MKRIAVLGSTGSIGTNCLEVAAAMPDRLTIDSLCAHSNWELLSQQAKEVRPRRVILADEGMKQVVSRSDLPEGVGLEFGSDAVEAAAASADVDIVVSAIVGAAGLRGTWAALEAGKTVALANKESLVVAGPLVTDLARRRGTTILPVDSEHSAVFQALQSGRRSEVRRVVLTASGGPFRTWTRERIEQATPEQALEHPTWSMGSKITIDSASMMNKALEVIEARWLFDLPADQIEVVVHPQSIVHSFVEFVDGSVIAQLSPPDMKLPIQYALTYPDRLNGPSPRLDLSETLRLDFEPPDFDRFPALSLGFEVARQGGTCGAVLNASNEAAVERFLNGNLAFPDIARVCRAVLETHQFDPSPTLSDLLRIDQWARKETERWTPSYSHSCLTSTPS
ncbi:MAG: 1-deoxy-D-xylulose-5-phosphate reductoisomerase [Planctomycetota bacterium]|nr:MAG: 1-deoxy-D-xylulose-5-phosphate reductoisomerase [Planctomycetota bacterium]REJ94317.1 MAG: 1-deoxy-D-xylulose-5-phosphate reductoisomerase [Planctomycetota bacterium]REK28993.1 MAG: 1-deoxy-D-xylulose-5-phosphate reductoisomerase [Planctomycetota bacterium]REK39713.1 MAG: 1-deoxy-D-xylulose-5-phosphate reductoisomerase [Planctomycetota bacterium]